jgi:hypothetical protein
MGTELLLGLLVPVAGVLGFLAGARVWARSSLRAVLRVEEERAARRQAEERLRAARARVAELEAER